MAMQEDLLGYLLGALSDDEMRRIARLLSERPELRDQLDALKEKTDVLENAYVPVDPPSVDLVACTLSLIDRQSLSVPTEGTKASSGADLPSRSGSIYEDCDSVKLSVPTSPIAASTSSRWLDWIGVAAAVTIFFGILLPTLTNERFEARKAACQDQLRRLGLALTQFVSRSPEQRLPAVAESGPEAFSGVYALRLNEAGLMPNSEVRWCPSIASPDTSENALVNLGEIQSVTTLHQAPVDQLKQIQRYAGGHYAYNLGVIDEDRYTPPKFESRASFAVMADTPLVGNLAVSDLGRSDELSKWLGHDGRGINVLYEDGRVRFISLDSLQAMPDHPLLNHQGNVEAGVNIDDASLAPSWRPPFTDVPQR